MKREQFPVTGISRHRIGTDGEGVRTLVVFHQCPLRCRYCINPSTWNGSREPAMMSAKELYKRVLIDRAYFLATNGGITFGGGEPLLHSRAIREFSDLNEDRFTLFTESSLNVPRDNLIFTVGAIDRYYIDIKSMNPEIYHRYTGGTLQPVLDNLSYLLDAAGSEKIVVRIPRIPKFTDERSQEWSKKELEKIGVKNFNLFSYRRVAGPGSVEGAPEI